MNMIEFDNSSASFNPPSLNFEHEYKCAILIFDDETWKTMLKDGSSQKAQSKTGRIYDNFLKYNEDTLLVYPNTGAPAAVIDFELLIASGIKRFVAFGTCGTFDVDIPQNSIIVPSFAVREEGTSYHYLPVDNQLKFSNELINSMLEYAQELDIAAIAGGVWTTDAVYRETENKISMMKNRGCIGADMELSALMSVAEYRKVKFAQFLIVDDLVPPQTVNRKIEERNVQKYVNLALGILKSL